jgi:pimeloyl-ACP methyl ester carboxylesterase
VYPRWLLATLRAFFVTLSVVAPRLAGAMAVRVFGTPQRHHRPEWEREIYERGSRLRLGSNLAARSWGEPRAPLVLLVHGWEGRGTQLGAFVDAFVSAGFRVIALDLPAHGDSTGRHTDLIECTEALRKVARDLGPLTAIVAHSFGGAVTTLAIERGMNVRAVVLVSSPSSVADVLARFGRMLGLGSRAMEAFRGGIEKRTGLKLADVELYERASRLRVPALIVHDRRDRDVPFSDAERLAARWPNATLLGTDGLGHRRILRDKHVVERVVQFVARESNPTSQIPNPNEAPNPRSHLPNDVGI